MACDKELRQVTGGCAKNRIRYQIIEDNILTYCEGLNVSDILPDSKQSQSELAALQKQLQARKGELKAKNYPKKIEHLEETIGDTQGREARRNLANRLQQHIEDQKSFEVQIQEIEAKITEHTKSKKGIEEQIKDVKELIVKMRELEGDERIELRLKLRIQLRGLIKRIVIHLDRNLLVIFFRSGQRRGIDLLTSEITIDSFPKSAGFIETDNGYIKKQ
jgi:predicted  nucleic acid-binding Zn-ribbon protein